MMFTAARPEATTLQAAPAAVRAGLPAVKFRPRWILALASCLPFAAGAQVYASGPQDGDAPVVLSNFASEATPLLLIDAPPAPAAVQARPTTLQAPAPAAAPTPTAAPAPAVPAALAGLFVNVARETALPAALLMAVAAVESGFDPRARSPKGAQGLMQLMPETARRHGVRHVWAAADNLRGGALHLRGLLQRYAGDLSLALAAYNAGEGAVLKAGGQVPDYPETQRYVPKVLAWHGEYAARALASLPAAAPPRRVAALQP